MRQLVTLAAAVLALAGAAPAPGGTVSVVDRLLVFSADPGEKNEVTAVLTAEGLAAGAATIRDASAPLTAGEGCGAVDGETVTCAFSELWAYEFDLGDGSDTARISGALVATYDEFRVNGDEGNDDISIQGLEEIPGAVNLFLFGDNGSDSLLGSPSSDLLYGGLGSDTLDGGAGDDHLEGEEGNDRIQGGIGTDAIEGSTFVNLQTGWARDGSRGTDRLRGIENVDGNDELRNVLVGDENANRLVGGWIGDRLVGGGGDDLLLGDDGRDVLVGGSGRDRIDAGAGNDVLFAQDGHRDDVRGRSGRDCARIDRGLDRVRGVETAACGRRGGAITGRRSGSERSAPGRA